MSKPSPVPFLICLGFVLCMLPFLNKAAHIDDPLFLWSAERILQQPFDFYGFSVNWYGWEMAMWEVMKNPPLTAYYLALLMALGGQSILWLHVGMLTPGVLSVLGTYMLANRLCGMGWLATTLTVIAAPFFLGAGSFMAETMLLAFWVWAIYCFVAGEQDNRPGLLALGSVLTGMAILAKYNGLVLIPLLLAYMLLRARRVRPRLLFLLIPVGIAAVYDWWTATIYGHGLLTSAMDYSLRYTDIAEKGVASLADITLTGLAFVGGSLIACGLLAPAAWGKRSIWLIVFTAVVMLLVAATGDIAGAALSGLDGWSWVAILQAGLFAACGLFMVALPCAETIRRRDAETILLSLWVLGQFLFATYLNWTINGRTILPLVPAAAILTVRAIEHRSSSRVRPEERIRFRPAWIAPIVLAGGLTLSLAWCDTQWANAGRAFARSFPDYLAKHAPVFEGDVYFAGHWGFQYAMQNQGFVPLDHQCSTVREGDLLVLPLGMLQKPIPLEYFERIDRISYPGCGWLAVHHEKGLSGFYSSVFGPLPYIVAPSRPHRFSVYTARTTVHFSPCTPFVLPPPGPARARSLQ